MPWLPAPVLLASVASLPAAPQDSIGIPTTVVKATRETEEWIEKPYSITVVGADDLSRRFARTTPQALLGVPGTSVQETGPGQGSPYLRGFTGYQTLMRIDGIRLNNSVFRSGPNQYWGTVDAYSIDRLEVVRGPSSVLFGSDAIGGTVNVVTRRPYGWGEGFQHSESLYYRFTSADQADVIRGEISTTWDDTTGVLIGADGKWFDDVSGEATPAPSKTPAMTSGPAT